MKFKLVLLFIVILALVAAAPTAKKVSGVSVWTYVKPGGAGPCGTDHFDPCPGCEVGVEWGMPAPPLTYPMRLDGWIEDRGECQLFHVTNYARCLPFGVVE